MNRTWNTLFSAMVVMGFLNGIAHRVLPAIVADPAGAVLGGFGISLVVWAALAVVTYFLWDGPDRPLTWRDQAVAALAIMMFVAPAPPLSWMALMFIGVHVAFTSPHGSRYRRGAIILLALIVPMFWSRVVFTLVGDQLLRLDAAMVAMATGAERVGNAIAFADGWGYFWIAPGCSSVANISLAFLTFVLVSRIPDRYARVPFPYCLFAVAAVVAINVLRMAITGISREHHALLHGTLGTVAVGWLSLAAMVGISLAGLKRGTLRAEA
jgi:hypothetical protein